jgi:hypothetical protein
LLVEVVVDATLEFGAVEDVIDVRGTKVVLGAEGKPLAVGALTTLFKAFC